jgi:glycerol kinase
MSAYILAIDQGTTSTRAIVLNRDAQLISQHQIKLQTYYPDNGWVEQNPEDIWQSTLGCCRGAIDAAKISVRDIAAIGITNQRETTLIWDRKTGEAVYPAIVWQDRRTAEWCQQQLVCSPLATKLSKRTGLILDPYFSATKIAWILEHQPGARERAERGELAFGTIDTFLLWRLTGGKRHVTDVTNASRTLLFNIYTMQWDDELLNFFNIPRALLPEVLDNCADFGSTLTALFGANIPIRGSAGDQQAASIGQACFEKGMLKSTYGTGCFMMLNTGLQSVSSKHQLLTTIAYRINGKIAYALEGSIFCAGASVQWLRDNLKIIQQSSDTEPLARSLESNSGVYCVPAFTGLGAPYWDPLARGAFVGLTRDTGVAHFARAVLEAVCYQSRDLMNAMKQDFHGDIAALRVDGGMVVNDWMLQFLADMLQVVVERPKSSETSVLGAAFLAGLGVGIYESLDEISKLWSCNQRFNPRMSIQQVEDLYHGWQQAVSRVRSI